MIDAPLALAFTAGLVATVNPCGFAMLPAYLAWFVGIESGENLPPLAARLSRALRVSALLSTTFVVVFGLVGVLVSVGAALITEVVPWLALVVGLGLVVGGVAMWRGWKPIVRLPQPSVGARARGSRHVVMFGVSYAIASLSCTLPVFLAVVAGTISSDLASGTAAFVAYGAGMSLVLVAVTVAVALTRGALVQRMRRASRHVDRAAAVLLVIAGVYITFYWAYTLAFPVGRDVRPWSHLANVPIRFVEQLSTSAITFLDRWALPVSLALAAVVGGALWVAWAGRSVPRRPISADRNPRDEHPERRDGESGDGPVGGEIRLGRESATN